MVLYPTIGIYGENFEQGIEDPEFRRGISSPSDARLLGVHLNLLSLLKGPAGNRFNYCFKSPDMFNNSKHFYLFFNEKN